MRPGMQKHGWYVKETPESRVIHIVIRYTICGLTLHSFFCFTDHYGADTGQESIITDDVF
jgi:hypothetical protein